MRVFVGHCGEEPRVTLVLTDGNGLMGLAVDTVRLMQIPGLLPSMLVVGVGYPDAAVVTDTIDRRFRHLTPTPSRRNEGSGQADAFVRFFRTELFPWLDARPSEVAHDLPGDEWRRIQRASGYRWILVNGEVTIEDDKETATHSGRLLRHGVG